MVFGPSAKDKNTLSGADSSEPSSSTKRKQDSCNSYPSSDSLASKKARSSSHSSCPDASDSLSCQGVLVDGSHREEADEDEDSAPTMVKAIVLSQVEWQQAKQKGSCLLRAFKPGHMELAVVTRVGYSYQYVGRIGFKNLEYVTKHTLQGLHFRCSNIYSQREVSRMRLSSKSLWLYEVNDCQPVSEPVDLPWLDSRFRNRVFKLNLHDQSQTPSKKVSVPSKLDIGETQPSTCSNVGRKAGRNCSGIDSPIFTARGCVWEQHVRVVMCALLSSSRLSNTLHARRPGYSLWRLMHIYPRCIHLLIFLYIYDIFK